MRRVLAVALTLAAAGAGLLALGAGDDTGDRLRVDAIFDNASFLIAGQDVRIAGATVGSVTGVSVTPDNRARIGLEIDPRYGPFRSDADCYIAPQSLIGERFIQCTPGTPRGRELVGRDGRPPTIPVTNTHSPVDFDIILDTFRLPVRQRLAIVLDELGSGLAGNGERLNGAIRRAHPALQATNRVLRIVDRDREVLGRLIERSDTVVAELARRRARVGSFIDEAGAVATVAAERRGAVTEGVGRLPETLRETRTALDALRVLADRARPLLGDLSAAATPATRLVRAIPPLALAARPTLARLGRTARVGRTTLREGAPVVRRLERFARLAVPAGSLVGALTVNLRETGAVEGLQSFLYNTALALARFDGDGHILPAYVVGPPECANYSAITIPSCDAHFVPGPETAAPGSPLSSAATRRSLDYLLGR